MNSPTNNRTLSKSNNPISDRDIHMAENERKGDQLISEANSKRWKSFITSWFGSSTKRDEAIKSYRKAAYSYKMANKWSEAGSAFSSIAALYSKGGRNERYDAATNYVDAHRCYKLSSESDKALSCLTKAIEIFTDLGKFSIAAKQHQKLAEIYESSKPANIYLAIQHYEQAADYFNGEGSDISANKCLAKVAQYSAQLGNYQKAIQIYEKVAYTYLGSNNSLSKYCVTEYFFRAALCHLCVDVVNAQHALNLYKNRYPALRYSREYELVKRLIDHMEENDVDGFTETASNYEFMLRRDQWFTTIMLRIKTKIAEVDLR